MRLRGSPPGGRWTGQGGLVGGNRAAEQESQQSVPLPTLACWEDRAVGVAGIQAPGAYPVSLLTDLDAHLGQWRGRGLPQVSLRDVSAGALTWPQIFKNLESPIACSNDFQVAIMFPTHGNWLYQLLMDYPPKKNVGGGQDTTSQLCSLGLHCPAAISQAASPLGDDRVAVWAHCSSFMAAGTPMG